MPFYIFVFFSALLLEVIGSYISISGLAAKTGIIVVIIAVALDFAKIVIVSVLYKKWKRLNSLLKIYLLPVLIVLISVTSAGAFGYLTQEFGQTMLSNEKQQSQLSLLENEYTKKQNRKKQIDEQIEKLAPDQINQRRRLTELYAAELANLNKGIIELEESIPKLKMSLIEERGTNGTIGSISKNLNIPPEDVINYLSLFMVLFIDPLAIVLLIVGNFLIEEDKIDKKKKEEELKAEKEEEKNRLQKEQQEKEVEKVVEIEKVVEVIKEVKVPYIHNEVEENNNVVKDYQLKDNKILENNIFIKNEAVIENNKELWTNYDEKENVLLELNKDTVIDEFKEIKNKEEASQEEISKKIINDIIDSVMDGEIEEEKHSILDGAVNPVKKINPPKYDFAVLLKAKAEDQDLEDMANFINTKK